MPRKPQGPKRPDPIHVGKHTVRAMADPPDAEGRWRWRIEWYVARKLKTYPMGRMRTEDVSAAAIDAVARGCTGARSRPSPAGTVKALLDAWIAEQEARADLAPGSLVSYRYRAEHLLGHLEHVQTDRIERDTLARYRDARMRAENASTYYVQQELTALAMAWTWGREHGIVPARDLPRLTIKVVPRREGRTPSPEEIQRVIEVLGQGSGRRARRDAPVWPRIALVVLWGTGCRIGELAELCWRDVDLEAGEIRFRGKGGHIRRVPVTAELQAELEGWRRLVLDSRIGALVGEALADAIEDDRVMGGAVRSVRNLGIYLQTACKEAKVQPFTPHGVRRAVVDALFRSGTDPATESALIGHGPTVALKYYRRPTGDDLRAAAVRAGLGSTVAALAGQVLPIRRTK